MNSSKKKNKSKVEGQPTDPLVCLCNEIPKSQIVAAISRGCDNLQKIANATTAGAGQCGGSCQTKILELIAAHKK